MVSASPSHLPLGSSHLNPISPRVNPKVHKGLLMTWPSNALTSTLMSSFSYLFSFSDLLKGPEFSRCEIMTVFLTCSFYSLILHFHRVHFLALSFFMDFPGQPLQNTHSLTLYLVYFSSGNRPLPPCEIIIWLSSFVSSISFMRPVIFVFYFSYLCITSVSSYMETDPNKLV